MEAENKNIIGYIVETDPWKDYGSPNITGRYLFQTKTMAYRYILRLVDEVKASYRKLLDSGYEELHYLDYASGEIDEEKSVPIDDAYTYSISTVIRASLGFEDVCIMLQRRTEADLSEIVPDFIGFIDPSTCKSDRPQYLSEPIQTTLISVIPVYSKSEEEIIQDLEITATADDAADFIRKKSANIVKLPGQPFMEFTFADNTEEEYIPG